MMSLKEMKKLLKKLEQTGTTCMECGQKYGVYSVGCSSVWNGKCGVCGEDKRVTESRDFGYFRTGIRDLKSQIEIEKNKNNLKKNSP